MKKIFITLISATLLLSYANAVGSKKRGHDREAMKPHDMEVKAEHMEKKMSKLFEKVDTDKNGQVSKDEFMNAHAMKFKEMDTDNNGSLSKEELKDGHKDVREGMRKKIRKFKKDRKHKKEEK